MRCKVLKPKGSVILRYVSSAKNPFDEQTSRMLSQGFPQILLEYSVIAANPAACEVHYDVTRMVTLSEYLRKPIDGEALREMLDQIKILLDTCATKHLPLMNVVFDVNQVYYDSWSRGVRFIYLPFNGMSPDAKKVQAFFTNLSTRVRPADAAAGQLIATYDAYVRAQASFDPVALCSFLGGIGAKTSLSSNGPAHAAPNARGDKLPACIDSFAGRIIRDRPASAAHERTAVPTPNETTVLVDLETSDPLTDQAAGTYGEEVGGEMRGKHALVDPGTSVLDGLTWESVSEEERASICAERESAFSGKSESVVTPENLPVETPSPRSIEVQNGTTVLDGDDDSVQDISCVPEDEYRQRLITEDCFKQQTRFWLAHLRSEDRVGLTGSRFVVGKSKYSDYQVRGTTTVSRSHALFCCEQDGCWIEDDDSKNGTFVNGQSLAPHTRRRLHDGDVIRMSDESFVFVEEQADA